MIKSIIAIIGLMGINAISYFVVLPMAQNDEDQHYDSLYLVLLYVGFAIALRFVVYKLHLENRGLFRWIINIAMVSFIAWAVKYFFLECSICAIDP